MSNAPRRAGRHFLQIPGPTPVPDRILRAMDMPVIDHRGPEFKALGLRVLAGIKTIFKTSSPVFIYPSSGTGAWEAALVNTLSPGDKVLMYETGHFATLWKSMADKLGLQPEFIASDWRSGADAAAIEARLKEDKGHAIKAVCVVHNETSTGATSRIDEVRRAIDAAQASGAADGRHHLLARLHRLPPRRVGRRCHRRRLAEGPDAAAGPRLQCGERQGAGRGEVLEAAEVVFLLGGHAAGQQGGLLPLHARHQPALRPGRGHRHAARGGPRPRVRPPRPARRRRAPRRRGRGASRSGARTRNITPPR